MPEQIDERALLGAAAAAAAEAYAPYSGLRVGAALLAEDGRVFRGWGVENASYGLTVCAERTALLAAVAGGSRAFRGLAVAASGATPPYPCGACRQVLAEFCDPALPILIACIGRLDRAVRTDLGTLLPRAFALREKTE